MIFVIFSLIATVSSSVFTDNLITINPTADSIIKHQGSYDKSLSKTKSFPYPTLAFVTPWNNHGYDIAKQVKKFTLVSPVWFNIKPDYTIQGQHDVDIAWIKDVKQGGAKIVPRFQLDQFRNDDFMNLIKSHQDQDILANEIYNIVDANEFDGIVLEVHLPKYLIDLIKKVALKLRKNKKIIVLVIGPVRDEKNDFTRIDFNILESSVDYFALMTYDYSSPSSPGPNSPLHWVEKSITQLTNSHFNKLLVGLNFYGNDFGDQGGAIVGKQFIELLKHHEPELIWDDDNGEHYFEYGQGGNMVYYPTLYSIQQRLEMMTEKGCGLMIWEIGQGLDYFYDLL